jgi:hypothetical protein
MYVEIFAPVSSQGKRKSTYAAIIISILYFSLVFIFNPRQRVWMRIISYQHFFEPTKALLPYFGWHPL